MEEFINDEIKTNAQAKRLQQYFLDRHLKGEAEIYLKEGPMGGCAGGIWYLVRKDEKPLTNTIHILAQVWWPNLEKAPKKAKWDDKNSKTEDGYYWAIYRRNTKPTWEIVRVIKDVVFRFHTEDEYTINEFTFSSNGRITGVLKMELRP